MLRLLDQVRRAVQARHYSPNTEKIYIKWINQFIPFHDKCHPMEVTEPEINALSTEWALQFAFPHTHYRLNQRSGEQRRHHVYESIVQKAVREAVHKAGLNK